MQAYSAQYSFQALETRSLPELSARNSDASLLFCNLIFRLRDGIRSGSHRFAQDDRAEGLGRTSEGGCPHIKPWLLAVAGEGARATHGIRTKRSSGAEAWSIIWLVSAPFDFAQGRLEVGPSQALSCWLLALCGGGQG